MRQDYTTSGRELMLTPTLRAKFMEDGRVRVTRKFIEGMKMYATMWPGPVSALMRHHDGPDGNLDPLVVDPAELPFGLFRADFANEREMAGMLVDAAVVLASLDCDQLGVSRVCARLGVPCVYASEYSVRTRREIIAATTPNRMVRWRRYVWTTRLESRQVDAVRRASGIQCNGTPTYDAYRHLTPASLLYFDTRVKERMLAGEEHLRRKQSGLMEGGPLRLAFSGRLIEMKGADRLPVIARELARRGVEYTLDIFGDGPCAAEIKKRIDEYGLSGRVVLRGVVDFERELMPFLCDGVDVMILPHPQGDPACTYLETLSAGVPIIGASNEAWRGIVRVAGGEGRHIGEVGRGVRGIVRAVERLNRDRRRLGMMMEAARDFSRGHTFEKTFARRVEHLVSVSRRATNPAHSYQESSGAVATARA